MTTYSIYAGKYNLEGNSGQSGDRTHPMPQQAGVATLSPRWDRLSDEALIAYCKAGHQPAWDALLNRYQDYLFRFSMHLCHNKAEADDVTARTLLRIYQSLHTFREESSFLAWITRIAYNLFLDSTVRARHSPILSLDHVQQMEESAISGYDLADPRPTPEQHYLDQVAVENITRAIQHLPGYMRGCMQMHLQGYSYEQMADALGVSLGTVKSRISRARSLLRERLTSQEKHKR